MPILEMLVLGTPPSPVAKDIRLRASKRNGMAKRTMKAMRMPPKALERRENNTGESHRRETKGVHAEVKRRSAKRPREPPRRGSEDLDREGA